MIIYQGATSPIIREWSLADGAGGKHLRAVERRARQMRLQQQTGDAI